jgi:uncharacterized protein (UPF0332 family)
MSTTPREILETSRRLVVLENLTEADFRAIASRAYYAALHGVKQCFSVENSLSQQNSHESIIGYADAYGKSVKPGRTEARQITRDMYLFKKRRKFADYEIDDTFQSEDANNSISLSSLILNHCDIIQAKLSEGSVS